MALTLNGSNNTIAGLAVGGLPDGTVDNDTLAANAITSAKITDGTIASGDLASGVGGKILQVVGSSYNTSALINTTTKTTTSMYQEITPSKAGSKLLFMLSLIHI